MYLSARGIRHKLWFCFAYLTVCGLAAVNVLPEGHAQTWAPKQAAIMTKFAAAVDPNKPLPEYPRPQLERSDWMNLNGIWEYQPGTATDAVPTGFTLSNRILVPFPVESALSGVMEHHDRLWYRRLFNLPAKWRDKEIMLNFGAVDYEAEVFINGRSIGTHHGGYAPFSYDISPFLHGKDPQELIVRVFDPTIEGGQPRGKQTTNPGGIMYTPTTGIWQTVWLEPVSDSAIQDLTIVPDIDKSTVKVTVNCSGVDGGTRATVHVLAGKSRVQTITGAANTELTIPIPNARLWSPDSPYLYDLDITLNRGRGVIDRVHSYFGMRKISIGVENGIKKMFLNNKFVFEIGPLDQGFWPDGIYTPPTDDAIKGDIQAIKDFGFNMVRKHIKVEPARWYYWTDHLGLLVWQDMPSANSYTPNTPPVDKTEFESELRDMVRTHISVPSIIMWDVFNEGQGQFDTPRLVQIVKDLDPSRLVNEASGGGYSGSGDIADVHSYPPPGCPAASSTQALACGEYGGIALLVPGHTWRPTGGGYTEVHGGHDLEELYGDFTYKLKDFSESRGLSAAVYTQITDVETELNGLMTYDRILKCDPNMISLANHFIYPMPTYREVLPTSEKTSQNWRYVTKAPGANWFTNDFDDSAWKSGAGGFGTSLTPGIGINGTVWNNDDIWIRRTFNPGQLTREQIDRLVLRDFHDEDIDVYLNGTLIYHAPGYITAYERQPFSAEGKKSIRPGADNTIAVHCHQTTGGQYVDVGIYEMVQAERK